MDTNSAERTAVIFGTIAVGSVFLGSLYPCASKSDGRPVCGQLPGVRPLVGALFAFGVISAIARPAPEIATGFAIAVGGVAYLTYAAPVVNSYFSGKGPKLSSLNNPIANQLARKAQGR